MAQNFNYKARDKTGKVVEGIIEGDTSGAVSMRLRQMGLIVLDLKQEGGASKTKESKIGTKKVKAKDLTIFARQFATMINAGLSLIKCLSILSTQTSSKPLREVIQKVAGDVEGGQALSDSMAKFPKVFPSVFINMTRAGETGGVLDDVLLRIADHLERENALRQKVKSAMTYPVLVLVMSVGLVTVMLVFIVPIFAQMFTTLGGELPGPTQALITASNLLTNYWWAIIAVIVGVVQVYKRLNKLPPVRAKLDSFKLKVPLFGPLFEKTAVARFSRTLGTLIRSGVPILQGLQICSQTAGNFVVSTALEKAKSSIKEGETIAKPLEESGVFPPMVVQMISVGEETGALDTMLSKIADFYDQEVEATVEALTSMIEPLMIVFLGVVVGGILISLYLPLFKIGTLITE